MGRGRTEEELRQRIAERRKAQFIEDLENAVASGGGFVAAFDSRMAKFIKDHPVGDNPGDRRFEWKGAHWIVERIAPAPCGCDEVRLAFVRKLGSKTRAWSGVRCPTGLHQETFFVELTS